jgi:protease-4
MKDLIHSILNIFHHAGRIISLIRNTIVNTFFLLVVAFIAISFFTSDKPEIQNNSILRLTLSGDIVEQRRPAAPFDTVVEEMLGIDPEPQQLVLQDILDIVQAAAKDPSISVMLLDLHDLGNVGLNQMQSIGRALNLFREQGKKVIAAEDFYTQKQYYLASYADTIIINPMGGVELHGFGVYPLYYKEALEKLQINYHVFRVGTYKSAIEPIIRDSMSDEVREQNGEWLNSLWANYTNDVTSQRGLPGDAISTYIENIDVNLAALNGDTAKLALENRLVDKLLTREEIENYLNTLTRDTSYSAVTTEEYLAKIKPSLNATAVDNNAIGIIVAEGTILDGQQPAGFIGSESLGDRIRSARNNNAIKGVVLRINSGGGSAFASEIIRQEILELKKTGKPLVVSMGTMAASGGYWIAADADQIWASPTTITGSIGIFGAIPTFERTLDQLGIHSDGVGTTSLSSGMNLTQPLTPAMKQSIQLTVDNGYARFLSIVENGRKINRDRLPAIAEGRVFSGEKAKELNLIDNLGSLDDAVEATAKLAGLKTHSVMYVEQKGSMRDQILQSLRINAASIFPDLFASSTPLHKVYHQIRKEITDFLLIDDPHNIYAHSMLHLSL